MMILGVSLPPSQRRCSRCAPVTSLWRGPYPAPAAASPCCCLLPAAPGLLCVLGARRPLFAASSSPLCLCVLAPAFLPLSHLLLVARPRRCIAGVGASPSGRPFRAAVSVPRLFSDCLASTSRPRGCTRSLHCSHVSPPPVMPCVPLPSASLRCCLLLAVGTSSTASLVHCSPSVSPLPCRLPCAEGRSAPSSAFVCAAICWPMLLLLSSTATGRPAIPYAGSHCMFASPWRARAWTLPLVVRGAPPAPRQAVVCCALFAWRLSWSRRWLINGTALCGDRLVGTGTYSVA